MEIQEWERKDEIICSVWSYEARKSFFSFTKWKNKVLKLSKIYIDVLNDMFIIADYENTNYIVLQPCTVNTVTSQLQSHENRIKIELHVQPLSAVLKAQKYHTAVKSLILQIYVDKQTISQMLEITKYAKRYISTRSSSSYFIQSGDISYPHSTTSASYTFPVPPSSATKKHTSSRDSLNALHGHTSENMSERSLMDRLKQLQNVQSSSIKTKSNTNIQEVAQRTLKDRLIALQSNKSGISDVESMERRFEDIAGRPTVNSSNMKSANFQIELDELGKSEVGQIIQLAQDEIALGIDMNEFDIENLLSEDDGSDSSVTSGDSDDIKCYTT